MSMTKTEKFGTEGQKQVETTKSVETVQPMDRPLAGQHLMNAVQSDLPKVTSYPY